jgi:tungstate transport system substrate-binding protein
VQHPARFGGKQRRSKLIRTALALAACALTACNTTRNPTLDIATTTSVVNSGLLAALLPEFASATVRVHATGSGRALEMLARGDVELVITHAPQTEARYLSQHPGWIYRKLAYNRFVIVGPKADPASVAQADSAADGFRRIANAKAPFISRGDESGTHERERELWAAAKVTQPIVLTSGAGMATTLRQADAEHAYTLTDEATWWQLEKDLDLSVVLAGDAMLLNTYAVITPGDRPRAAAFAEWLSDGKGRELIGAFQIAGRKAFGLWPPDCPRDAPARTPCSVIGAR